MNKYPLLSKLLLIGFLMALLAIPLALVRGVVAERSAHRQEATQEVARAHAGPQTVTGPVLWLPYTETYLRAVKVDGKAGETREDVARLLGKNKMAWRNHGDGAAGPVLALSLSDTLANPEERASIARLICVGVASAGAVAGWRCESA